MSDLKKMQGDPAKITICGKEMSIKKLSITKSLELIDLWGKADSKAIEKGTIQDSAKLMISFVSFISGIDAKEIDKESTFEEIVEAFGVLYQKEMLPLLKGAEKFREILNPKK